MSISLDIATLTSRAADGAFICATLSKGPPLNFPPHELHRVANSDSSLGFSLFPVVSLSLVSFQVFIAGHGCPLSFESYDYLCRNRMHSLWSVFSSCRVPPRRFALAREHHTAISP